ncbi:MAG: ATP-binding cassette domain-containing protein, partial [Chloroflexi bacterium]|nr:ATP-binding cassette domain-containing protein [Chloroflexota bacterium]
MSSNNAASPSAPKIQIRDLEVSRGGRRVLQIDDLAIAAREVSVIIGPNGSGKSTLLGVLQLLIKPDRGELLLDGRPMRDDPLATRRRMASVFQEALLLNTTIRKNVETALRLHKVPRADR